MNDKISNIKIFLYSICFIIWIEATSVIEKFIFNNITILFLKIILMIICPIITLLILLIIFSVIGSLFKKECPFLNDLRMLKFGLCYDAYYSNNYFCSVSDSIHPYFEHTFGVTHRISSTNEYLSFCLNGGRGCPIYEKYKRLSRKELLYHYQNKT